jgi:hypothetical protein
MIPRPAFATRLAWLLPAHAGCNLPLSRQGVDPQRARRVAEKVPLKEAYREGIVRKYPSFFVNSIKPKGSQGTWVADEISTASFRIARQLALRGAGT